MPASCTESAVSTLLAPRSIVVVGASTRPGHFGNQVLLNLRSYGYEGGVFATHPTAAEIHGVPCVPEIEDLPEVPDTAVIVVRSERTPDVVRECGRTGIPTAIVVGSGYAETGDVPGQKAQADLIAAAKEFGVRLCGPNTLGMANFTTGAVAFVSANIPTTGLGGGIAIVSQSGGIGFTILNRGWSRGLGFSHLIVAGNEADLTISDYLDGLLEMADIRVMLCYLEAVRGGSRLLEVVATARRNGTPVVMVKGGRSEAGGIAATAHTGALATSSAVFDGVMAQAGGLVVDTIDEALATTALIERYGKPPKGRRVGVYGMGGGMSVMLADRLEGRGLELPPPTASTARAIKAILPDTTPGNPFDSGGQFFSNIGTPLLPRALGTFMSDPTFDLLVVGCMPVHATRARRSTTDAIISASNDADKPCAVLHFAAPPLTDGMSSALTHAGLAVFDPPEAAIAAIAAWLRWSEADDEEAIAIEMQESYDIGHQNADASDRFAKWIASDRRIVTEFDALAMLETYGAPVAASRIATSAAELADVGSELRGPLVVKALGEAIPHRAAIGALITGISTSSQLNEAWGLIDQRVSEETGQQLQRVIVQEMQTTGLELLVGVKRDPQFGLVLVIGMGGVGVETWERIVVRRPEMSMDCLIGMLDELNFGGRAPSLANAIRPIVAALSSMIVDHGEHIESLDLNPVIITGRDDVCIVDALLELRPVSPNPDRD